MPMKYTPEGSEDEIEVFTAEEVAAREDAAKKAALESELPALTEKVKADLLADPNGSFASARRQADKDLKTAQKEVERLTGELGKAGQSAEEIQSLQTQLQEAKEAKDAAGQQVTDLQASHARDLALIAAGVKSEKLATVKTVLQTAGIDLSDAEAVKTALDGLKADAAGFFTDVKPAPYDPSKGANRPPIKEGALTIDEAAKLSPGEYYRQVFQKQQP